MGERNKKLQELMKMIQNRNDRPTKNIESMKKYWTEISEIKKKYRKHKWQK